MREMWGDCTRLSPLARVDDVAAQCEVNDLLPQARSGERKDSHDLHKGVTKGGQVGMELPTGGMTRRACHVSS